MRAGLRRGRACRAATRSSTEAPGDPGRGNVGTQGCGSGWLNLRRRGARRKRCHAVIDDVQLEAAGLAQEDVVAAQPRLVAIGVVEGAVIGRADEGARPSVLGRCPVDAHGEREAEPVGRGAVDGAGAALQRALVGRAGVGVAPGARRGERSAVADDGVAEVAVVVGALPERVGGQHGGASG
jgi:hypothetical protein